MARAGGRPAAPVSGFLFDDQHLGRPGEAPLPGNLARRTWSAYCTGAVGDVKSLDIDNPPGEAIGSFLCSDTSSWFIWHVGCLPVGLILAIVPGNPIGGARRGDEVDRGQRRPRLERTNSG